MRDIAIDMKGKRIGKLVVIEKSETVNKRAMWLCKCDCGNTKIVMGKELRDGSVVSCGCASHDRLKNYFKEHPEQRRRIADEHKKHGMVNSRLYRVWIGMKGRCNNKNHSGYKNYGARGIKLSAEWDNDFEKFYNDMSPSYIGGYTIERIDNSKGYSKDNCKWIPRSEQNKNRRGNRYYEYEGKRITLSELCRIKGVNYSTVVSRLNIGMDIKTAINKPIGA